MVVRRLASAFRTWIWSAIFPGLTWLVLPTPTALLFNKVRVPDARDPAELPATEWSQRERRRLLSESEDRLRSIEAKGPGLAVVVAVVAAAILLAIDGEWAHSCLAGRLLLGGAAFYATWSLCMPLYLVGPQPRASITETEVVEAAEREDPEEALAREAARAAAANNQRNVRFANLQNAARREAFYALVLLVVWLIAVPLTGWAQR